MSSYLKAEELVSGQEGRAYAQIDGDNEEMLYLRNITATVTKKKSEVRTLGKRGVQNKAVGWSGKGTMSVYYVTTKFRSLMADYIRTGVDTLFDIVVVNDDPSSGFGTQTVAGVSNYDCQNAVKMLQEGIGAQQDGDYDTDNAEKLYGIVENKLPEGEGYLATEYDPQLLFQPGFREFVMFVDETVWGAAKLDTTFCVKDSDSVWNVNMQNNNVIKTNGLTEENLRKQLETLITKDLNIIEKIKNVGYYSTDDAIDIVLKYGNIIAEVSKQLDIPEAMIQAVLFKEIRMKDFRDDIADSAVMGYYRYKHEAEIYNSFSRWQQTLIGSPPPLPLMREDSSTGLGQIFAKTAIDALKNINGIKIDFNNWQEREKIWNALRDDETNIYYVGLVLKSKAKENSINLSNASENQIESTLAAYNGGGTEAREYGREVFQYYKLFQQFN